jgi:isoamyl acetate esterase
MSQKMKKDYHHQQQQQQHRGSGGNITAVTSSETNSATHDDDDKDTSNMIVTAGSTTTTKTTTRANKTHTAPATTTEAKKNNNNNNNGRQQQEVNVLKSSLRGGRMNIQSMNDILQRSYDVSEAFSGEFSLSDESEQSTHTPVDIAPMRPNRRASVVDLTMHLRPAIITFGDSLTQEGYGVNGGVGWISLLQSSYVRRADIYHRGFSGYNTQHASDMLGRVFGRIPTQVLFTTIWFGANDCATVDSAQYVSPDAYEENLTGIVTRMRRILKPVTQMPVNRRGIGAVTGEFDYVHFPILLLTPPPVHETMWKEWKGLDVSDRCNDRARQYGDIVKKVALTCGDPYIAVVDVWELLDGDHDLKTRAQYLSDGLHLNTAGNRKVYQGIMECLRNNFPHLLPMEDGNGKYGTTGIPMEEKLWQELVNVPLP